MNCKETFSDIVAVWPLPVGSVNYAIPFNVRKRIYDLADMGWTDLSILDTLPHYSIGESYTGVDVVELEERESTLKSTTRATRGGRVHDVVLALIISEKSDKAINLSETLDAARHDFLIQIADGSYLLIRTQENAYKSESSEEYAAEYRLRHTITVENYNGIIRINS